MMADRIVVDHIAVATERITSASPILTGMLGGKPHFGMDSGNFRFGQWRFKAGGRIEVLEPAGTDGFLHRFLAKHGPGIHHVTFKVPNLRTACERAESHGYTIVGYNDSDPRWEEAFLHPKEALGRQHRLPFWGCAHEPDPWSGQEHNGSCFFRANARSSLEMS